MRLHTKLRNKKVEIIPNNGIPYLAIVVYPYEIYEYLEFEIPQNFRNNRELRDGQKYHITISHKVGDHDKYSGSYDIDMLGIGIVSKNDSSAYFIVCESSIDTKHDQHITIGFSPKDVHNIRKNRDTII